MNPSTHERQKYVWGILTTVLCGRAVEIKQSTNPEIEGLKGEIEDETSNMLRIRGNDDKIRWIPKKGQIFIIELPDKSKVTVEGRFLDGTPENRIKRKLLRW